MININEPLITVQKNVLTEEFSLHLKNFDSAYGEGYTKQEVEELIIHLQKGVQHLHSCWEESGSGNLFGEDVYGTEKTIAR